MTNKDEIFTSPSEQHAPVDMNILLPDENVDSISLGELRKIIRNVLQEITLRQRSSKMMR